MKKPGDEEEGDFPGLFFLAQEVADSASLGQEDISEDDQDIPLSMFDQGCEEVGILLNVCGTRIPPAIIEPDPNDDPEDVPRISKSRRTPGGTGLSLNYGPSAARRRRSIC